MEIIYQSVHDVIKQQLSRNRRNGNAAYGEMP